MMADQSPNVGRRPLDFTSRPRHDRTPPCPFCCHQHASRPCPAMRDVLAAAELHAVATIAASTLPVRVLAPGVSGEMLARCGGDPERANTLLAQRRERADHDRLEPRAFTVGSVWMDSLSLVRGSNQVRVIGAHGTFVRFSGMRGGRTFTLPRERARARMRFVESGK